MKLIWLDLETTGLDPKSDAILEIAISEADFLRPFDAKPIYHEVLAYDGRHMDPFVRQMHTRSGLLDACAQAKKTMYDIEPELLALVPLVEDSEERPILAGATVSFDKSFIREYWPTFHMLFSHRLYDTSAIKLFCRSLGMEKILKGEAHRAREDVREAIEHADVCVRWLRWTWAEQDRDLTEP